MAGIIQYDRRQSNGFAFEVSTRSSQNIMACYQCRKCAAGCPVAETTGITPDQLIRSIVLNDRRKALENKLVWQCVSCYTCGTRCPNKIHVGRVTETLKKMAAEEKFKPIRHSVKNFHEAFSSSIKHMGRINELEFMSLYGIKNGIHYLRHMRLGSLLREYVNQMFLGLKMVNKKRMHFGFEKTNDKGGDLKRLYRKAKEIRRQV